MTSNHNPTEEPTSPRPPPTSSSSSDSESDDLHRQIVQAPPFWKNPKKKVLSKQLSMCETARDVAWEKRRRQSFRRSGGKAAELSPEDSITDEDLDELKGCIELGFGFSEELDGQKLCNTLPALDLYFAVNRQLSPSPVSTPHSGDSSSSLGGRSSSFGSPRGDSDWKICSPGDNPQQVKTRLRHWAQAVACSLMQSHN